MKKLDMTGKPCPIPVVEARKILADPAAEAAEILVDNIVAVQNLEKMAKGTGLAFAQTQLGEALYSVQLRKEGAFDNSSLVMGAAPAAGSTSSTQAAPAAGATVLITSGALGNGSEELGAILMKGFIFSLTELNPPPTQVIFLNGGARLTCEGANVLDDLKALADKGTQIFTCGTCANYYKLTEKLAVGEITDMMGITSRITTAQRLITL